MEKIGKKYMLALFLAFLLRVRTETIINGDFEDPVGVSNEMRINGGNGISGWAGKFYLLPSSFASCFSEGQCVNIIGNGRRYISQ